MKKLKLIAIFALMCQTLFAQTVLHEQEYDDESDFEIQLINLNTAVHITGYNGNNTEIRIPVQINNLPVKEIGYDAFHNPNLTGVIIPNTVTHIGPSAFSDNQICGITISSSITDIAYTAFKNNNITHIDILADDIPMPIGLFDNGFRDRYAENNRKPGKYYYENGAWKIEYDIFENGYHANILDDGKSVMITDYTGRNRSILIPDTLQNLPVTEIGRMAFANKNLRSVIIPSTVKSIGGASFINNQITSVLIPNSVVSIGNMAFKNNRLTRVIIPHSPKRIERYTFSENRLLEIIFPETVTSIEGHAFEKNLLKEIDIPNTITSIGAGAFMDNELERINLPQSITVLWSSVFCRNKLKSVVIPETITLIREDAFRENHIDSIIIGANVDIPYYNSFDFNSFEQSFVRFYKSNGRKKGVYTYSGGQWHWNHE